MNWLRNLMKRFWPSIPGRHRPPPNPQGLGVGIMYLTNSDQAGDPIHDLNGDPEWTNPYVSGVALRTSWERLEPHEHANASDFYWGFLDQGVTLAAQYHKKLSILVTAGVTTPDWVYDAGAESFNVTVATMTLNDSGALPQATITVQKMNNEIVAPGTIYVLTNLGLQTVTYTSVVGNSFTGCAGGTGTVINNSDVLYKQLMPLPWDAVFQAKWSAFLTAFATRYGSAGLSYIVMGGFGRRAESFFVSTAADQAALDAVAIADGFAASTVNGVPVPAGMTAWLNGATFVVGQYGVKFPNTTFQLDLGAPAPTTAGNAVLQALCDYGSTTFKKTFSVKSDGLSYPNGPPNNSIGVTEVKKLSPTYKVGYQFGLPASDPTDADNTLRRGIGFGAHFIEVYAGNCDNPAMASALDAANTSMAR